MKERFVDLIQIKKDGGTLSPEQLKWMIKSYTAGEIPDYQMSAMLMAICFQGMSDEELGVMTSAMAHSGTMVDLSTIPGVKVDKHSTGGVGDKTTLVIAPIVAAAGVPVAKMSGRGLGFTGGTVDKLESIPGFRTDLTQDEFLENVKGNGICIAGQSSQLAPADKKLYALRDVTATVESIPLIAASIMSKKLAAGSDKILLGVTTGSGAFIKDYESSKELAKRMVAIGLHAGKETVAMITSMDEPLGYAIGNQIEVIEAIDVLKGKGSKDLQDVCFALAANMIILAGVAKDLKSARKIVKEKIEDGSAFQKFADMVQRQGGDISYLENPSLFPKAACSGEVKAEKDGFISKMNTSGIGVASGMLGAGRETKDSVIDPCAGILLAKKIDDSVKKGEVIARLYAADEELIHTAAVHFAKQITIGEEQIGNRQLIYKKITGDSID